MPYSGDVVTQAQPMDLGRVLFLNENIGGHATMHRGIRQALETDDRAEADFVDVPGRGPLRRVLTAGIPGLRDLDADFVALRSQWAHSAVARRCLQRALATGAYDALHVYSQHAALASTGILAGMPSVVSTDCSATQLARLLPQRKPGRLTGFSARLARAAERRVVEAATMVVAQSEWAAASLRETAGVDDERLRVVRFGIVPFDVERSDGSGPPEITFIGTQMGRKGGWRLLEVFQRHLERAAILNLVTRDTVALSPNVRVFPDFVPGDPRLPGLLGRSAMLVFPTDTDTFGYVTLEAMSAALPVVATRVNAIPEIVEDGETGLLVPVGDDDALRRAICELLDDPTRARKMGDAGRRRLLAHFDARVTTSELLGVIGEAETRFRG